MALSHDFDGRLVVVTGGTGALGEAVCDWLLRAGARVRIPAFSDAELERCEVATRDGVDVVRGVDLTDPDAVDDFYAGAQDLWASLQIAGGFAMGPIGGDDAVSQYDKMMAMNARTCFLCCRWAAAAIQTGRHGSEGGRIVNVSARGGIIPREGKSLVAYTASKAAVAAITEALAAELQPKRIWVNAVAPSILDTPANRSAMPDANFDAWPKPAELAETIGFLASPSNAVTTGAIVPVYGVS